MILIKYIIVANKVRQETPREGKRVRDYEKGLSQGGLKSRNIIIYS
jgi:hypothetical protein